LKQLFTASVGHIRQSFSIATYSLCLATIAVACLLNYYTAFSLWPYAHSFTHTFLFLFVLFLVFFLLGFFFTGFNKHVFINRSRYVWILILGPLVFALKVAFPFNDWLLAQVSPVYQAAFRNASCWLGGFLFIIPALLLMHYFFEKRYCLYFINKTNTFLPYLLLLLCMFPLLVFASSQTSFQEVYPRGKDVSVAFGSNISLFHYTVFELSYALDFITIELFFRGFLIAVLSRVLGVHAIVPTALFYFSIHLGKPMLEAISSFFGGIILGAVSYETKSIWGGWLVHCGIALLMELLAFFF
jgi:membrane protease YdiL (CAAX protease family)